MTDPRQRARSQTAGGSAAMGERERVLARRRMALVILIALVPITLVAAIVTGSTVVLVANLVADLLIAVYVTLLLQIKQSQASSRARFGMRPQSDEDVRVVQR